MPANIVLEFVIGIPSKVVLFKVLGYGGAFNGGTKCSPKAILDLDVAGSASLTVPPMEWGGTYKYNEADVVAVPGKPEWFCDLRNGAVSIDHARLERNKNNLDVQFAKMDSATHAVRFAVVGANPLLSLAPSIDLDVVVGLRKTGDGVYFSVKGKHDGFPNYALLIGGNSVYAWDCVESGLDPSSLGPPADRVVDIGWRKL
ncbi:hypothetical protein [Zoogloea sp.]|jgi:hypothetical protein|uniref:hypothetical protein n=1 Tax=Zoogloea sp. TaxID=49181 RepID=UPI0037DA45A6